MAKIAKKKGEHQVRKLIAQNIYELAFPKGYSIREVGTSQSLLQELLRCRQCYLYALNCYEKIGKKNNTGFGSMTHEVLDKMYSFNKKHGVPPSNEMIDAWLSKFRVDHPEDLSGMTDQDIEAVTGVNYVLLTEYLLFYADDFKQVKFEEIEKVSSCMFEGFKLRRKTDGKFRIHGQKWIMEHKTKGYISENNLLLQLSFDFQNLFYITCEEIDFPHDPVAGVLYNVIRNPKSEQNKSETLPVFLERLRKDVHSRPEHYFKRFEICYNEDDKKQFIKELRVILQMAEDIITGKAPLFKNTSACVGAWTCEYLDACSSGKLSGYEKGKFLFPELSIGI